LEQNGSIDDLNTKSLRRIDWDIWNGLFKMPEKGNRELEQWRPWWSLK